MWGYGSFSSEQVTISVEAPSQDLTVTFGSQSGTITAGSGRQSVTLTLGVGDTGNLSFKIKRAAAGSVDFGEVKLEAGSSASPWTQRALVHEEALCRRYTLVLNPPSTLGAGLGYMTTTTVAKVLVSTPTPMRVTPSVIIDVSKTRIYQNNSVRGVSSIVPVGVLPNGVTLDCTITIAGTIYATAAIVLLSGGKLTLDAEL